MTSILWFRRDLRLHDHPALVEACATGAVLPLFVVDPRLWGPAGPARRGYLVASLRSLDAALREQGAQLGVLHGDPTTCVPRAAREVGATAVHVTADFGPYGSRRDLDVEAALADEGIALTRTGSSYAVAPGEVTSGSGSPYKVFTPFAKAWAGHGWPTPMTATAPDTWLTLPTSDGLPDIDLPHGLTLPEAGEEAARRRWRAFLEDGVDHYDEERNRPDLDGTSRMSVHLKWGEIHPRTMLADLERHSPATGSGPATYRKELAWREFYADVLFARPETARTHLRPEFDRMEYDDPAGPAGAELEAWRQGRTGFPIVDAGMRQLRATGWMHNRVRMIVASFLVKDLHLSWRHGARHFMTWLVDGDLASNQHGWQWTAGSGTDASPFFRVFNPTSQGRRFDPHGHYVRRWVPELGPVADPHDPSPDERGTVDYPRPLVDHAEERLEALDRWERIRR